MIKLIKYNLYNLLLLFAFVLFINHDSICMENLGPILENITDIENTENLKDSELVNLVQPEINNNIIDNNNSVNLNKRKKFLSFLLNNSFKITVLGSLAAIGVGNYILISNMQEGCNEMDRACTECASKLQSCEQIVEYICSLFGNCS